MCGFGNKDRRPCTPPPILKLTVRDKNNNEVDPRTLDVSFYMAIASLTSSDGIHDIDLVKHKVMDNNTQNQSYDSNNNTDEYSVSENDSEERNFVIHPEDFFRMHSVEKGVKRDQYLKILVGNTVSTASVLFDLNGDPGIFFIFYDLSIRKDGKFKLKFSFFTLQW
ncbi:hypothetical protein AYI69_g1630 [Smittium culicis]|uniref:Velvet domain-containing protein n=1 Tax=Smittium culicis TaxID=133412 RepID=A0A1R1XGJ1_9FUNG|nr:hypothetical protein AYI69_g8864 [Smittium culicis]OMJ28880.1 hypothetical protein AYI69_g1630 [Smittium culicis]